MANDSATTPDPPRPDRRGLIAPGVWHCDHCVTVLGTVWEDNQTLDLAPASLRRLSLNNRGMLQVQCGGCGYWSLWWQCGPYTTPEP